MLDLTGLTSVLGIAHSFHYIVSYIRNWVCFCIGIDSGESFLLQWACYCYLLWTVQRCWGVWAQDT